MVTRHPLPQPHDDMTHHHSPSSLSCHCGNQISSSQITDTSHPQHQYNDAPLVCQPCAIQLLASKISRYHSAKEHRHHAEEECTNRLWKTRLVSGHRQTPGGNVVDFNKDRHHLNDEPQSSSYHRYTALPDPNHLHHQSSLLKQRLDILRAHTNELALRLTAKTMENDERQERLQDNANRVTLAQERLHQMRMCLLMQSERLFEKADSTCGNQNNNDSDGDSTANECDDKNHSNDLVRYQEGVGGGLTDALHCSTHEIQTLRFHMACKVFDMHRLDIGEQYTSNNTTTTTASAAQHQQWQHEKTASGVGKISGLPLPHAGPVLYGVIPPEVLSSSLRLVASLTQLVSCCLGVVLPHPILVYSMECKACGCMSDGSGGDIIDATMVDEHDDDDDERNHDEDCPFILCNACRSDGLANNDARTMTQNPLSSSSSTSTTQTRSKSFILSLVGSSARRAITLTTAVTSRAISQIQPSSNIASNQTSGARFHQHTTSPQKMGNPRPRFHRGEVSNENLAATTTRRIQYASYAYLRENHDTSAAEYLLNPPRWGGSEAGRSGAKSTDGDTIQSLGGHNGKVTNGATATSMKAHQTTTTTYSTREEFRVAEERFATGLQLLQNDIVALCFRAGVDVSTLWPAESVLLNLHALCCHCRVMGRKGGARTL